jgi:Protein of unknown function (DUF3575)
VDVSVRHRRPAPFGCVHVKITPRAGYVISQSWQRANMTFMVMKCPKEHVPTWKCRTNWF